jgi:hypothetical protein
LYFFLKSEGFYRSFFKKIVVFFKKSESVFVV